MVLDYPFVWPPWNAAESSQRQACRHSLTLSESTTRGSAVLGVAHATSGITAKVLILLLPRNILAHNQLNPYLQAARRKEVEQWQSDADHNVIANSLGKSIAHSSTARIPYSEFSLLTLIGTAFP
jgi:hypothetical protein